MKKPFAFICILLTASATVVAQQQFEWEKKLNHIAATIHFLEDKETAVLVPTANTGTRYIAEQLPQEYKKEGLQVVFYGWEGKIPPHYRMLAKPLKLKCICISKHEKNRFSLAKRQYSFK